jgi:hypothetical protein
MPTVPTDGRPQFDPSTVMIANASLGRPLTAGVETVTPWGSYILANTWPKPRPSQPTSGFSGLASSPAAEPRPMTPGRALWPHLA